MKLSKIQERGYKAGIEGKPIDCPFKGERARASWEIGWRRGKEAREGVKA